MDLGEAVQTAIDAGLPLLLSTEAGGELKDTVRVGRMKGRPGMLTITSSDGVSATTRRVVAEQAIGSLIALKRSKAKVTLSAGARQLVRMTMAQPLADDPVLLGRQREMAALKVVGSGVDASAVGTGKTISSGRALAHRASTQPRFRGLVIAEGRLLGQWRDELAQGAPGRGLPPLAPNVELLLISDDRQVAGVGVHATDALAHARSAQPRRLRHRWHRDHRRPPTAPGRLRPGRPRTRRRSRTRRRIEAAFGLDRPPARPPGRGGRTAAPKALSFWPAGRSSTSGRCRLAPRSTLACLLAVGDPRGYKRVISAALPRRHSAFRDLGSLAAAPARGPHLADDRIHDLAGSDSSRSRSGCRSRWRGSGDGDRARKAIARWRSGARLP